MQQNTITKDDEYSDIVGQFDNLNIGTSDIFASLIPECILSIDNPYVRITLIVLYFIATSWLIVLLLILLIICFIGWSCVDFVCRLVEDK